MKLVIRLVFLVLTICLLGLTIARSQSDAGRYQYYSEWYQPTFKTEGKVNAVVIGRSGMQTAMNADKFSSAMRNITKGDFVTVDLSKSWSGADTQYIQARDVLNNLDVDTLLVQMYPDVAREHEIFYELATYRQIFQGSFAYGNMPLIDKLQRAMSLSLKKWTSHISNTVSLKYNTYLSVVPKSGNSDPTPNPEPQNDQAQADWTEAVGDDWENKPSDLWSLDADYDARNRYFYKKIISLAKKHNTRLIFLFLPELYQPVMSKDFVAKLEKEYGDITIIAPRRDDLVWMYPKAYADHGHANAEGQDYIINMYAKQLVSILEGEGLTFEPAISTNQVNSKSENKGATSRFKAIPNNMLIIGEALWLFEGDGQKYTVNDAGLTTIKFGDSTPAVHVNKEYVINAGETYRSTLQIKQIGGAYPANVRLILSRDCSSSLDDSSSSQVAVPPNMPAELVVEHTFREKHGCSKLVLQVLNAYPDKPIEIEIVHSQLDKL